MVKYHKHKSKFFMKNLVMLFLSCCILMATANTSSAQIGKRLKAKKEELANKISGQSTTSGSSAKTGEVKETVGISSEMHKKYMNQVVFSNDVIEPKQEDESQFISSYKVGDPLWLRVYMDNSLTNYIYTAPEAKGKKDEGMDGLNFSSTYQFDFYLNGKKVCTAYEDIFRFSTEEKNTWTTFRGSFSSKEEETFYFGEEAFKEFIIAAESQLTKGTHDFKMEIIPCFHPKEIEMPMSEDVFGEPFNTNHKIVGELKLVVDGTLVDKSETKICLPNPSIEDAQQEALFLKVFNQQFPKMETFEKVVIVDNKWTVVRNEYTGVIISKYIYAIVPIRDNGKCFSAKYKLIQDFEGTGYGRVYGEFDEQERIACGCLE